MIPVLFAIPSMGLGGSELVMLNLLRGLDTRRFEAHLAMLTSTGDRIVDIPAHVAVHELGVDRARNAVIPLISLCWKIRPRAILSTSAHLNSAVVATRPFLPKRTALLTREGANITAPGSTTRARLLIYRHLYRRADAVICQSDAMKRELMRAFGLPGSKAIRIYNPVDFEQIWELARSEPDPYSDKGSRLVAVGRFSHEKGFDLLLQSMAMFRRVFPSSTLTLVGDGPDRSALEVMRDKLGMANCVHFVGSKRNPYPYIKHANLLVLPSRCEALPNVVLEAIALGTRVAATNCTAALREITHYTDLLHLACDTSSEALAKVMMHALAMKETRPSTAPEAHFVAEFGLKSVVKQYETAVLACIDPDLVHPSPSNTLAGQTAQID